MNISKFLLFEAALAIAAIPLLLLLKGSNKKSSLFGSSNKDELLAKSYIKRPDKEKLLDLEKLTMREGYNREFDSLVGDWKFVSIWRKDTEDEDSIFSSLLRFFSANLELIRSSSSQNQIEFSISISIQFGFFSIKFSGSGYLKGKQSLLIYFFNLIEFKSGSNVLLRRSIKEPVEKKKSFFALIASDESDGWLAARGQSGALILWLKD